MDRRTDRSRGPRMSLMIERLATFGIHVDEAKVLARAGGAVGRPHLAAELLEMGVVETFQQAFDDWIGDGAPANVERPRPTLAEASARVHAAGGFCSLAHPVYYGVPIEEVLELLSSLGIEAVEAFHGGHTDAYRDEVWRAAVERGLSVTVGSDHHGPEHHPAPVIGRSRLRTCLRRSGTCGSTAKQPIDDEPNLEEEHHWKRHQKQGQRIGGETKAPMTTQPNHT